MPNCLATVSDPALAVVRQVVQSLGTALGRAAGVVDCEFNQLAYSDDVPTLRGTAQLASQLRRVGGFGSLRPVWLPGDPTLAAPATVWLPIRYEDRLLGFLWLVHAGVPLSREEMERAGIAARDIASALRHGRVGRDVLLQQLLGPDVWERQRAARRLLEEQTYLADLGVVALVAADAGDGGLRRPRLREDAGRYPFQLLAEDHVAVLVPGRRSDVGVLSNRLAAQLGEVVGIGQWYPHVRFGYESYREALGAARAAARVTDLGRVVPWAALGVYRTFAHLPDGVLAQSSIHPGLERLFSEPAHQPLLAALETYLDCAGNVPLAAQRLHLHRASLYYRLRRVEQLLEMDLRDGNQRLCLHMAFKLGRFTGRYPLSAAGGPATLRESG